MTATESDFALAVRADCARPGCDHPEGLGCGNARRELERRRADLAALARKLEAARAEMRSMPDDALTEVFLFGRDGLQYLAMGELQRRAKFDMRARESRAPHSR